MDREEVLPSFDSIHFKNAPMNGWLVGLWIKAYCLQERPWPAEGASSLDVFLKYILDDI